MTTLFLVYISPTRRVQNSYIKKATLKVAAPGAFVTLPTAWEKVEVYRYAKMAQMSSTSTTNETSQTTVKQNEAGIFRTNGYQCMNVKIVAMGHHRKMR